MIFFIIFSIGVCFNTLLSDNRVLTLRIA